MLHRVWFRISGSLMLMLMAVAFAMRPSLAAAQQNAKTNPATLLAPHLESQTLVVVRFDLAKFDLQAAMEFATPLLNGAGVPAENLKHGTEHMRNFQAAWREAGGSEIFVVASPLDAPRPPAYVLARVAPQGDAQKLSAQLGGLQFETVERLGNFLYVGSRATLDRLKTQTPVESPDLKAAFDACDGAVLQVVAYLPTDTRRVVRELGPPLPGELGVRNLDELVSAFRWAAIGVNTAPQWSLKLTIEADSPAGADKLRNTLASGLKLASAHPHVQKNVPQIEKIGAKLMPQVKGNRLSLELTNDGTDALRELLAVPLAEARKSAARNVSVNNLKQIALAFHNYHDVYNKFPPAASRGPQGKPLLSWRVHVLPYLDQAELYQKFKLDEPWDSAHNKPLVAMMPACYMVPGTEELAKAGKTMYVVPVGPKSVFESADGTPIRKILDGTSNTILALQVPESAAVVWTQPSDWEFKVEQPLAGLMAEGLDGWNVAICDGSVRFIPKSIMPNSFRKLLQASDGEPIDPM